jgi:glycosyltransferase involved in cell wall biosynthesis
MKEPAAQAVTQRPDVSPQILMLLTNAYDPDPRVRQEALALIGMGCRVRLLAWDRDAKAPASQLMEGIEVERVFLASKHGRGTLQLMFYVVLYLRLLWRGLRTPFDIVHCHDLDTLPIGYLLAKLKRKPVIYDAHESFTDMIRGSIHPIVYRTLVHFESFLIRRIDLLITVGEKLRRHFEQRGSPHSVVVGNWKRLEEFSRSDRQNAEVRRQLGIPSTAFIVVCITQLLKDRKIEELLQAINESPNVYLIISGRGVLQASVEEAVLANPRIIFLGFISGQKIADYTCAADVVYYGFDPANPNARFSAPNKLFEALAAGRPLITGDFGEIAEVVRETGAGIVLPKYGVPEICSAFKVLADRTVRDVMSSNAQRFARTAMNWEKGEDILYREYNALLPTSGLARLGETQDQLLSKMKGQ